MEWDIDNPELPFKKPSELEEIEKIDSKQREAMDKVEMQNRINGAAVSIAEAYAENNGKDPEDCVAIIHSALTEMGGSLGGKFGAAMVGMAEKAAHFACQKVFPEEYELCFPVLPED